MEATLEFTPVLSEITPGEQTTQPVEAVESELTEAERQQWLWIFEHLKHADIGLSFSEKAKIFCEASGPGEIEEFIRTKIEEQKIIPLAA